MKKTLSYLELFLLLLAVVLILTPKLVLAQTVSDRLKGKILLQVESKGEAWYISPSDGKKYSMGRPNDAFALMRQLGVGISNDNLKKISIGNENLSGQDSDADGLSDMVEDSLGTDKNSKDTDGDGYEDKSELLSGHNPQGTGKILIDGVFSKKQGGKILLQVEGKGEAWYVSPADSKRYFLGRPVDAFNLMRKLGLGVSNGDLNKISEQKASDVAQSVVPEKVVASSNSCDAFPDKLESCSVFKCQFIHPLSSVSMKKEITGLVNGKCHYIEEMPNNGRMECNYEESFRKAVAQYYRDVDTASSSETNLSWKYGEASEIKYFVNGKEVVNPLQEASDTGVCLIYGY